QEPLTPSRTLEPLLVSFPLSRKPRLGGSRLSRVATAATPLPHISPPLASLRSSALRVPACPTPPPIVPSVQKRLDRPARRARSQSPSSSPRFPSRHVLRSL